MERWYRQERYQPYETGTMVSLMAEIKSIVPKYVRISRVLRDIPARFITAGCKDSLREVVRQKMRRKGIECRCIRCREYGHRAREGRETGQPRLTRLDYRAAGGKEVFLSFEDETETLFGLLRLRIQPQGEGKSAVIRELHIYGPEVPIAEQKEGAAQHRGLGKALLQEAEKIAGDEFKAPKMSILSGIGAREYYRSEFGYSLQGAYMVKELGPLNSL